MKIRFTLENQYGTVLQDTVTVLRDRRTAECAGTRWFKRELEAIRRAGLTYECNVWRIEENGNETCLVTIPEKSLSW